ncbi:MAG: hypothetical protein AVDCRST_MAG30-3630 [uncultured Solirubrobacteraceae bacterium]|uniref:Uncharacterized protein n=1 Tax=uncultured Solirubrobacteraceae bacterium TaxID=1162706 RepID=A0A6J4TRI0_9ACTN|nr:MAG: hypothetical protein AVDCRST_MAG30-3630 [uncultured Solirubrobacteraceae bacterium]
MSRDPDHNHHVRRVVLPSGRSIEVVYFDPQPETAEGAAPAPAATPSTTEQLHLCPECDAGLVYPMEWEEVSATQWEVDLRCPNCEWFHVGTYQQDVVDRFDDELDRGTAALVRDLKQLTRANMEEEMERFRIALDSDAIWPMDF